MSGIGGSTSAPCLGQLVFSVSSLRSAFRKSSLRTTIPGSSSGMVPTYGCSCTEAQAPPNRFSEVTTMRIGVGCSPEYPVRHTLRSRVALISLWWLLGCRTAMGMVRIASFVPTESLVPEYWIWLNTELMWQIAFAPASLSAAVNPSSSPRTSFASSFRKAMRRGASWLSPPV